MAILYLCDLENWWMSLKNNRTHPLSYTSFVHHFKTIHEFKLELQSGNAQFRSKSAYFLPVWHWNLMDDLEKQDDTSFILHQALCIISKRCMNSNWSYSPETLNSVQKRRLLSRETLKFDRWPWKTIGHLFNIASSFVHHFIAIREFKLELQSGNVQFGAKSLFFWAVWPRKFEDDIEKQSLAYHHHMWIQTGVMVQKRLNWVLTSVTLSFDLWLWPVAWTSLLSVLI